MAEKEQITHLKDTIREERLEVFFAQAPLAIILSPMAAAILVGAIWEVVERDLAISWVVVVTSMALLRFGLVAAFNARRSRVSSRIWERLFISTLSLTGLAWGVGAWLLLPEPFAYRAVVFFFVMGMASAAVAVYAIHWVAVVITVLALVLPATVEFLLQDSLPERLMGITVLLFVVAAFRSLRITSHFVQRAHSLSYELHEAKEHAETLARTDHLTGLHNRRSFYDSCETPFKLARRHGQALAAILFDIDRFKKINDAHGHAVGDEVLRILSRIVFETCRASDVAGRVGGEEFAILLPHTNATNAQELAERLREQMEQSVVHVGKSEVKFTASFGVVQMRAECESLEALVAAADAAMYQAKERGKNCVFVATPAARADAAF